MNLIMNEHFSAAAIAICSALFSAAVAIIGPLRTKQIDRKMQAEKIKHELYTSKRIQCIEKFTQHVSSTIFYKPDIYSKSEYCDIILIYIDKSLHWYVYEICCSLSERNYIRASVLLTELCAKLQAIH